MKSAYGQQTSVPDYELTRVEPGSPMGELMRRYWQPVCTSDELRDLPRKEKLLCEEIVVFRDKKGRVGAFEPHCAHRGTSLEWGRIEEEGLRSRTTDLARYHRRACYERTTSIALSESQGAQP